MFLSLSFHTSNAEAESLYGDVCSAWRGGRTGCGSPYGREAGGVWPAWGLHRPDSLECWNNSSYGQSASYHCT